MVQAKLIDVYEPVSDSLLARIRAGAMISRRTPMDFKRLLVHQGLVNNPDAVISDNGTDPISKR